jgi:GT2 family glycosyltransferase
VVAVVATYRRGPELARLWDALLAQSVPLAAVVVADNAGEDPIRKFVEQSGGSGIKGHYIPMPGNPGCGAGLAGAIRKGQEEYGRRISHFWILDDDVVFPPDALESLLKGLEESGARVGVPLLTDQEGRLCEIPEPVFKPWRRLIRKSIRTPEELRKVMGLDPVPIFWSPGPCVLVAGDAVESEGTPRTDFWMLGEDVEYTLRMGARYGMVLIPRVEAGHWRPQTGPSSGWDYRVYVKFCAHLQNLAYMAFRLPYRRHLWRYVPGNYLRFLGIYGGAGFAWADAAGCFWTGALRGEPAGGDWGRDLREKRKKTERLKG